MKATTKKKKEKEKKKEREKERTKTYNGNQLVQGNPFRDILVLGQFYY